MKRHAHSAFWFLYWGLAILAALLAVFLVSVRLIVDDLSDYRQDIEKLLSEQLSARVHIAGISGGWRGAHPAVKLHSFSLDGLSADSGLSLALLNGEVALDPLASVKQLAPIFSQFDLSGLTVRYDLAKADQKQLSEGGAQKSAVAHQPSTSQSRSDGSGLLEFLLLQSAVNIDDTQIVVRQKNGDEISVSPIHLSLQNDGVLHQLKVNADLVAKTGTADITFVAEVEGDPKRSTTDFYLNISGLSAQLLNPWLSLADISIEDLDAEQEIWGQSKAGKLIYLTGKTGIKRFKFEEYAFDDFSLHTALIRRDSGYQLQLNDITVAGEQQLLELPGISLDFQRSGMAISPKRLMLDAVDLEQISSWLIEQPYIPEGASSVIKTLAPVGTVENIKVDWLSGAELADFSLNADLKTVGINAWDDVPELKGIDGFLNADMHGGAIHLTSDQFSMMYPTLFDYRWDYSYANGVIGWRLDEKGVVVASQLLNLKNESLAAAGRFSIYLPYDRDEQPLLNLQIGMQQGDGLQAKYYIPPKEVGQETYNWLVDAIKAGHIKQAGFVLNGVTRARLDDYQMPVVQMFFDVADAEFEYQPGWPGIQGSEAFVFFRDGELVAEAKGGSIYDTAIGSAWVHLPNSIDKLFIAGNVSGQALDLQKLLTETPLKEEVGDDLASWQMRGQAKTLIDIELPLVAKKTPKVQVITDIRGGGFTSKEDKIDFTDIQGQVIYDSLKGLSSKKLSATLFNQPVVSSIRTSKQKTQVNISGKVEADFMRRWLDLELLKIADGTLTYSARLDMCPGKTCNQLVINSDLQGLGLNAVAGLSKSAGEKMPLTVVSDLGRQYGDGRSAVRLNLNDQLRGIIVNRGQDVDRARFTLGGERPEVPEKAGIWIDGAVNELEYDELSAFLTGSGLIAEPDSNAAEQSDNSEALFKQVSLSVGRFNFEGNQLENLWVDFSPQKQGWLLALDSKQVAGTVLLPFEDKPYQVKLRHLNYQSADEAAGSQAEQATDYQMDMSDIPAIDFTIEEVVANKKPMGRWSFALRPSEQGAQVENIKADLLGSTVDGQIRWDKGSSEVTDLTVKLTSSDFGKVLKAWGYEDAIETKSLDAYLQLSWLGAPWSFSVAKADGELQFTAKQGRLLDVGNSGNFLRVFGILNLQSLGRRLRLDFSDLLESGVAFDEMKASYKILQGVAQTSEPFVMTGPSANLAMQGSLNLVNETVDKDIEVALPVTGNIPLVSVLLGAPQVAGAVFLFDKIIGDPLAKFTTVKYHMSGDWGDPQIDIEKDAKKEEPPVTEVDS
ncbi:YhdP family protein [Neptuniibacter caesariensis]|uniref:YhdP central domain-containing protein n=1 Tax=Neptuniibacter caesariensis TaxID=207954 RepID=A0A7U8C3Z1_NEPCE|nr:YhdP family protein [Neptuniibacter caesariensis]EAR61052.1 hypothetical protein MED92_01544 [Neptuniibacter caesariensis]